MENVIPEVYDLLGGYINFEDVHNCSQVSRGMYHNMRSVMSQHIETRWIDLTPRTHESSMTMVDTLMRTVLGCDDVLLSLVTTRHNDIIRITKQMGVVYYMSIYDADTLRLHKKFKNHISHQIHNWINHGVRRGTELLFVTLWIQTIWIVGSTNKIDINYLLLKAMVGSDENVIRNIFNTLCYTIQELHIKMSRSEIYNIIYTYSESQEIYTHFDPYFINTIRTVCVPFLCRRVLPFKQPLESYLSGKIGWKNHRYRNLDTERKNSTTTITKP